MPILRSASGLVRPMVGRAGGPLSNSPPNVAAPPIITPPSDYNFDMSQPGTAMRGWPGSNNQFANFEKTRDWAANFADQQESFAGIRWQPSWPEILGFYGTWQPAGGDVKRIRRKGTSGQDLRTLVLECGPNPAAVPAGDKVVLWLQPSAGAYDAATTYNLSGYNLPLKQKMTVVRSTGSPWGVIDGTRIIELDAGQDLPAIDFTVPTYSGGWYTKTTIQHRHWSFYADSSTKALRHPLSWYTDLSLNSVLKNGGYIMLGGVQHQPTWVDWEREHQLLGASLTEELWRLECEGLAHYYGNTDPRRCAVELENETVWPWADHTSNGVQRAGAGRLIRDVFYPIARTAWGPERTIVLKATNYGALSSLINEFDIPCPAGHNCHLVIHNYDNQINGPGGQYAWTDIGQTNWIADQIRAKINSLGYKGGGATEIGVDKGRVPNDWDRGQRLGRMLTSFTNRDLYMFVWSMSGDSVRCADVQTINGKSIEAYWREIAPYARRAGIMTT